MDCLDQVYKAPRCDALVTKQVSMVLQAQRAKGTFRAEEGLMQVRLSEVAR